MEKFFVENVCLDAPGLAIKGSSSALFKYSNTFRVKAGGLVSDAITTADAPALSLSKGPQAAATSNLADGYCRWYTLLGSISATDGTVTMSLVHGSDYSGTDNPVPLTSYINQGNKGDAAKVAIGYVHIYNHSSADFVPGTTDLDASNVTTTYYDNFGFIGM